MRRIKSILFLLLPVLMISSCIKPYDPQILANDEKKYVVNGQVTDGDGLQKVNVSLTSPIGDAEYIPVTGCAIKILDDKGNEFVMTDLSNGDYTTWIDPALVTPGVSFKLEVTTPTGELIVSGFDRITECPGVDSVYFNRKDLEGNIPGILTLGIQFYINLNGTASNSSFYRWEILETYEYHAEYPLEWYYDGTVHHVVPPDYSKKVCWATVKVPNIFTLSTNNLAENKYQMLPLHFISNRTSRLMYGYSLLVKQYALSEEAYIYWDQLRINSDQQGGLYEKQPLAIKGNMHNKTHPESEVLGFFGATSVKSKRIFVQNVPDLPLDFYNYCSPTQLRMGLREITPRDYPAYLMGDAETYYNVVLNAECVDCLLLGGTNVKPDFWPY